MVALQLGVQLCQLLQLIFLQVAVQQPVSCCDSRSCRAAAVSLWSEVMLSTHIVWHDTFGIAPAKVARKLDLSGSKHAEVGLQVSHAPAGSQWTWQAKRPRCSRGQQHTSKARVALPFAMQKCNLPALSDEVIATIKDCQAGAAGVAHLLAAQRKLRALLDSGTQRCQLPPQLLQLAPRLPQAILGCLPLLLLCLGQRAEG